MLDDKTSNGGQLVLRFSGPAACLEPNAESPDKRASRFPLGELQVRREAHNATTTICKFPPEILGGIFYILSHDWPRDWLRVTHVCRRWREIALDWTPLWTRLDFSHPGPLVKAMFLRSKEAPLTISFDGQKDTFTDTLPEVLSNVQRLREVSVSSHHSKELDFSKLFAAWTTRNAPVLQRLHLYYGRIPSGFLQRGAPVLTHLCLKSCELEWKNAPLISSLVELQYHAVYRKERPPVALFMESLRSLTMLQRLDLSRTLPLKEPWVEKSLCLRGLTSLVLSDEFALVAHFLSLVQLPSLEFVYLSPCGRMPPLDELVTAEKSILSNLRNTLKTNQRALAGLQYLRMATMCTFEVQFGDFDSYGDCWDSLSLIHSTVCMYVGESLPALNDIFGLSQLQFLEVDAHAHPEQWDVSIWIYLGRLPSLRIVTFDGTTLGALLDFFDLLDPASRSLLDPTDDTERAQDDSQTSNTSDPFFPALWAICCVGLDFSEQGMERRGGIVRHIAELLDKRSQSSHPIANFSVKRSLHFRLEEIAVLNQLAPSLRLVWDEFKELPVLE